MIRQFIGIVFWPFKVDIGWWNRLQVLIGTFCTSAVMRGDIRYDWIYALIWFWVYQVTMILVYQRGQARGAYRLVTDFQQFAQGRELREVMEMQLNRQWVAVEDLKRLCRKYGISFEEVKPIIERGFGMQVVDRPDDDG